MRRAVVCPAEIVLVLAENLDAVARALLRRARDGEAGVVGVVAPGLVVGLPEGESAVGFSNGPTLGGGVQGKVDRTAVGPRHEAREAGSEDEKEEGEEWLADHGVLVV